MKKAVILFILFFRISAPDLKAQPNCRFAFAGDSTCRKACELVNYFLEYNQGSFESQSGLDMMLSFCPKLAYAWQQKSIPFLKRGDFENWRLYLDRAVELEPELYLGYRAGCLFDVPRDYEAVLADLDRLEKLRKGSPLGMNPSGDVDLRIIRALAWRELGESGKSLKILEETLTDLEKQHRVGLADYHHYGVNLFRLGRHKDALKQFEKQLKVNPAFADTYYYMALSSRKLGERKKALALMQKAKEMYEAGQFRNDPYDSTWPGQIYLSDINAALQEF